MEATRITRSTKPEDIHARFLAALCQGDLAPGQRVGEVSLAARWGVSRLPVRDALIRLEAEGLVERRKQSGTYITEASLEEALEIYALRAVIERWVVRQVAEVVTEAQLEELKLLANKADATRPGDRVEAIIDRESRFHLRLCEIAGLRYTLRILNLNYLFARSFQLMAQKTGGGPTSIHKELVEALRSRDADRCEELIKQEAIKHRAAIEEHFQTPTADSKTPQTA